MNKWFFDRVPENAIQGILSAYNSGKLEDVYQALKSHRVIPTGAICGTCKKEVSVVMAMDYAITHFWTEEQATYEESQQRSSVPGEGYPDDG